MGANWNPALYQSGYSFVWEYGRGLVELLAPRPGERILDVGCGTGQLTAEIARLGAEVIGIDSSPAMIEEARKNYPELRFGLADLLSLAFREEFDAVFSNAVLHWILEADAAGDAIARVLRPGGRLVAELGGRGNVQALLGAVCESVRAFGVKEPEKLCPWYFPSVGEYAALLERHGLEVTSAVLFDRLTPLKGGAQGLSDWMAMFTGQLAGAVPPEKQSEFLKLVERRAAPRSLRDGVWHADYRRLRVVAIKNPGGGR